MIGTERTTARNRLRSYSPEPDADSLDESSNPHTGRSKFGNSIPLFENFKIKALIAITFFFITLFLFRHFFNSVAEPRVVTPFPAPKIMDLPQVNFNFNYIIFITLYLT